MNEDSDRTSRKLPHHSPVREQSSSADRSNAANFTRNSALSLGRLFSGSVVALLLPAYLTHKLPVMFYSAWVLIIQLGAYVGYLDLGIQTGISKYVAEFEARNDSRGASMRASAGLALMLGASVLGALLTLILAANVSHIFHNMPNSLIRDARMSLIFVGFSLSFTLLCSIFSSVFLGLQRYAIPMILSLTNRMLFAVAVIAAVHFRSSLAVMGAVVALANIITGIAQFEAWRRFARHINLSLRGLDFGIIRKMLSYCSALAIWTAGMLCVSGLDVTIVGRYDFGQTAFYSVATLPTLFAISIMGAALAPLLPTASALSVHRTPLQMGNLLSRVTRYSSILLLGSGLPLLVAGYWLLSLWVGHNYAVHTLPYLRILVIANVIRNMCFPYASMLVATNRQRVAIAGVVTEAIVNVVSSILLADRIGAIGVAYGTLIGSFVSVAMHFAFSMHYTHSQFAVSRTHLFLSGLARPALIAVPSMLTVQFWWLAGAPNFGLVAWVLLVLSTLSLAWYVTLDSDERTSVIDTVTTRFRS